MADHGTIARPYAIAAFRQAREEDQVARWSEMLELLEAVIGDRLMRGLIASPKVRREQLAELIVEVCGDRLTDSARNFVRLLAERRRLEVVPEIRRLFEAERKRAERRSEVHVISAFELPEEVRERIAAAMRERLGTDIDLSVEIDPALIGGAVVRAGDLVIDASIRGQLQQLAARLA